MMNNKMDQSMIGNNQHNIRNCSINGRSSVEELNQEIEELVLEDMSTKVPEATPEGHRAPIAELFTLCRRSVSTQTPYSLDLDSDTDWDEDETMYEDGVDIYLEGSSSSRDSAISDDDEDQDYDVVLEEEDGEVHHSSRRASAAAGGHCCSSPVRIVSGFSEAKFEMIRSNNHYNNNGGAGGALGGQQQQHRQQLRPLCINNILTRKPPDGCDKMKLMTELDMMKAKADSGPLQQHLAHRYLEHGPCLVPQKAGLVLVPSQSSAFLPLSHHNNRHKMAAAPGAGSHSFVAVAGPLRPSFVVGPGPQLPMEDSQPLEGPLLSHMMTTQLNIPDGTGPGVPLALGGAALGPGGYPATSL
ncbi:hypothetical protein HDE_09608 [Halotydeus destructor]|nr:hypothetical protein HDE_09608 [Halotydeus destructor]